MKLMLLSIISVLYVLQTNGQKVSTVISVGAGISLTEIPENCDLTSNRRSILAISEYYKINEHCLAGIEFSVSNMISRNPFGGTNFCSEYDQSTNTLTYDSYNLKAGSMMLKFRYIFSGKKLQPYFESGAGINTVSNNSIVTSDNPKIRRRNFVIVPGAGFMANRFQLEVRFVVGGKSAAYKGFDSFSQQNIELKSTRQSALYLIAGFRLFGK